ncbi:MAG: nucleotidyltransferase domain-containing protein [Candidatus Geothermarchaeales archaeon]
MPYSRDDAIRIARRFLGEATFRHRIRRAFLFGSCVWGRLAEHSDIDLAVVLDISTASEASEFGEAFEIFHEAQEYNSALEVVCFTLEDFESDGAALIRRIKKDGLEIELTRMSPGRLP